MKNRIVIALSVVMVAPAIADPVLIPIDPPPAWPVTARLERPHSDETPVCDASAALARWAPEQPRERPHRRWRHRVMRIHR